MDNQQNQNNAIAQENIYESKTKKEARKEKWKRIGIGAIIIFIFAALGGGDGLSFLALTIICTAGISLLIYIPLSWLLGTIVITAYRILFKKYINKFDEGEEAKIDNNNKAIIDYILQARGVGFSDDKIKQTLILEGGWSKEEVEKAFKIKSLIK